MSQLLWALRYGVFGAAGLVLIATAALLLILELPFELFWVVLTGLIVGQVIGNTTEFFTSYEYRPTQWIAKQAATGPASVVIGGIAVGLVSVVIPTIAVAAGIFVADTGALCPAVTLDDASPEALTITGGNYRGYLIDASSPRITPARSMMPAVTISPIAGRAQPRRPTMPA